MGEPNQGTCTSTSGLPTSVMSTAFVAYKSHLFIDLIFSNKLITRVKNSKRFYFIPKTNLLL